VPYLSTSQVVIHYEEALYQVYAPLPFTYRFSLTFPLALSFQWRKVFQFQFALQFWLDFRFSF